MSTRSFASRDLRREYDGKAGNSPPVKPKKLYGLDKVGEQAAMTSL
jgi:hypothetical protein